jgi:hypothetical protein
MPPFTGRCASTAVRSNPITSVDNRRAKQSIACLRVPECVRCDQTQQLSRSGIERFEFVRHSFSRRRNSVAVSVATSIRFKMEESARKSIRFYRGFVHAGGAAEAGCCVHGDCACNAKENSKSRVVQVNPGVVNVISRLLNSTTTKGVYLCRRGD